MREHLWRVLCLGCVLCTSGLWACSNSVSVDPLASPGDVAPPTSPDDQPFPNRPCVDDQDCADLGAGVVCFEGLCQGAEVTCESVEDCAALGDAFDCVDGVCEVRPRLLCEQDIDCEDAFEGLGVCQRSACVGSRCEVVAAAAGVACGAQDSCAPGACNGDGDCERLPDDSLCADDNFCNGDELCRPSDAQANSLGCVDVPRLVDDNIDCTIDGCDEEAGEVTHDAEGCDCVDDDDCAATCFTGACVEGQCVFEALAEGSPCDDRFDCTVDDACTAAQACVGQPVDSRCGSRGDGCARPAVCQPGHAETDELGCLEPLSPAVCGGDDGPVFWLDARTGLSLNAESQVNNLQGERRRYGGDIPVVGSISAEPRPGNIYIYELRFMGLYESPPTVVLDAREGGNVHGDTFSWSLRNVSTTGFELHVYRTDLPGQGYAKGPDSVAWSVTEEALVSHWDNLASAGSGAVQPEPVRQPSRVGGFGRPLVRFQDDWMEFRRPVQGDFTIFLVFRSDDDGSAWQWYNCPALVGGERSGIYRDMGLILCAGRLGWGAYDGDFDVLSAEGELYNDGAFRVVTLTRRQDIGAVELYVDGVMVQAGLGVTSTLDGTDVLRLARHPSGTGRLDADYAEVLMYDRILDDGAREEVEAYLAARWTSP